MVALEDLVALVNRRIPDEELLVVLGLVALAQVAILLVLGLEDLELRLVHGRARVGVRG